MWQAFVTIYIQFQKLYSYGVVCIVETHRFEYKKQFKLSFGILIAQMVYLWLISSQRMCFYANNIPMAFKYGVTDFVVDMILWAMLLESKTMFWTLHSKAVEITELLNFCGNESCLGKKKSKLNIYTVAFLIRNIEDNIGHAYKNNCRPFKSEAGLEIPANILYARFVHPVSTINVDHDYNPWKYSNPSRTEHLSAKDRGKHRYFYESSCLFVRKCHRDVCDDCA